MKIERRNYPVTDMEVRSDEGKPVTIRGYAAVFDKFSVPLGGFKEKIRSGAFGKSLKKNNVKALWNHNSDFPLGSTNGKTLILEEDEKGLRFELELPDNTWGRDAAIAIQRKDVDGVSFGFGVDKDEWDHSNPNESIRTLIDVNIVEISPTPFPAYPATSVSARSIMNAEQGNDGEDLKEMIRSVMKEIVDSLKPVKIVDEEQGDGEPEVRHNIDSMKRRLEFAEKTQ